VQLGSGVSTGLKEGGPTEDLVGGGLEEEAAVEHLATTPQYGGEFC
jgi:hypothetical protein